MRQATTPTHTFDVDVDLREATVWITYAQHKRIILEKHGADITKTETTLTCDLTQEETLKFKKGEVDIQIRYVFSDGKADAYPIITTTAEEVLKKEVIYYEG